MTIEPLSGVRERLDFRISADSSLLQSWVSGCTMAVLAQYPARLWRVLKVEIFQRFATLPSLAKAFVQVSTPVDRASFWLQAVNQLC
jgi:hypothetical protein